MGQQKQPMAIKNIIRDQYQKNSENSMQVFYMYFTSLFKAHFVLVSFTLVSSAFPGICVMFRIITN